MELTNKIAAGLTSSQYVANIAKANNDKIKTADELFAVFEKVSAGFRYTRQTFDKYVGQMTAKK